MKSIGGELDFRRMERRTTGQKMVYNGVDGDDCHLKSIFNNHDSGQMKCVHLSLRPFLRFINAQFWDCKLVSGFERNASSFLAVLSRNNRTTQLWT